ncbi:hypothetical protein DCAR_0622820 [Daucus carota subsp. sativus]|uniref:Cytochrome P450 n=1 Tax=Daucus carota subsp. sativus TaxID=79200 RepID=A0AAF0X8J9_DAUCS|nr:PREDICTED: geraniol 8-hydroxylase-like [Daucus carota subsp. sativus]WOH03423.1 hypothetical protein DCAR_0622820 [Daucus carota subsp. sativus]
MAREVLQTHDAEFSGRSIPDAVVGGQQNYDVSVAWISAQDQWRTIRRVLNIYFTNTKKVEMLEVLRLKVVTQMVDHIKEISRRGQAVDIGKLAFTTALNQMSNTCFSEDVAGFDSDQDDNGFYKGVKTIMKVVGKINCADYFPWLKTFDPQGIRKEAWGAYGWLDQVCEKFINQRLRHRESKLPPYGDLLDSFLDFQQQNPDDFNIMHIKALLTDLFIAGTDNISSTIGWAMSELVLHPDVMHKVRGEISERIKGKERLEEAETLELHYLQSVLKETMRLHLTVPLLLPHKSETDVKLNGYMIPKNTRVIINAWAIAHDTNSWENPDHFKPERFIGSEIDYKGQHFSFLPFGSGRRMCSGIRLAERAMSLILVSLVAHFDWKLPNNMLPEELDMDDTFGVTAQRATPLLLIPTPASN